MTNSNTVTFGIILLTSVVSSTTMASDSQLHIWRCANEGAQVEKSSLLFFSELTNKNDQYIASYINSSQNDGSVDMTQNVTKDTFGQYEKRIDSNIEKIVSDIQQINDKIDGLATKDDLEALGENLKVEIEKSNKEVIIWVLLGITGVLSAILGFLFFNPEIAFNVFRALSGK